jgi:hypothetical protein
MLSCNHAVQIEPRFGAQSWLFKIALRKLTSPFAFIFKRLNESAGFSSQKSFDGMSGA